MDVRACGRAAMRSTASMTFASSAGRPPRGWRREVHLRRTSSRCQRKRVDGVTRNVCQAPREEPGWRRLGEDDRAAAVSAEGSDDAGPPAGRVRRGSRCPWSGRRSARRPPNQSAYEERVRATRIPPAKPFLGETGDLKETLAQRRCRESGCPSALADRNLDPKGLVALQWTLDGVRRHPVTRRHLSGC